MTKREAYAAGFSEGDDASQAFEVTDLDRREAGCGCEDECEDCLTFVAFECESNNRQLASSPFCDGSFNEVPDSRIDGVYAAYDAGVAKAIKRNVAAYLKARKTDDAAASL